MFQFHDIEQNTDEWLGLRAGKMTSSAFSKVMANYGAAFGKPAKDYAVSICIERMTGRPISGGFSNGHTERGHEQEPLAIMAYEEENFCEVLKGGFFDLGDVGCSPDGRVGEDGLIEVKSVIPSVHYANITRQSYDPTYKWQLYGNLKLTQREWIDFISFCANFPQDKQIYRCRLYRSQLAEEFAMIDKRLDEFRLLIEKTHKQISESNYMVDAI